MSFYQARILNKNTNKDISRAYRFRALNLLIAFSVTIAFLYVLEHRVNIWDDTNLNLMAIVFMVFLLFFIRRKTIPSANPFVARWGRDTAILFFFSLLSPFFLLLSPLFAVREFLLMKEARLAKVLSKSILENLDVFLKTKLTNFSNCYLVVMSLNDMGEQRLKEASLIMENPSASLKYWGYDERLLTDKETVAVKNFSIF